MVKTKTILVTGGAGFIGSHLVDKLVNFGHRVLVVDDLSTGKLTNLVRGVSFFHANINGSAIEEIFQKERPEIVFHYAAQINTTRSLREPVKDAEVNILGTLALIDASRQYGVEKFIFSSTGGAIYGDPEYTPCGEDHPIGPLSPYGLSKFVGEQYLALYNRIYRLNYVALRYGNVYGPRQDPFGEAGVIAIFANAMLNGKQPRIFGDGEQQRDFIYVGDVVEANLSAMQEGVAGIYNIGTGTGSSVNEVFQLLGESMRFRRKPVYSPARLGDVWQISLDCTKAKLEMGWAPKVNLSEGLVRTAEYFWNLGKPSG